MKDAEAGRLDRRAGRRGLERAVQLAVVGLAALLYVALAGRQTLSVDELFSLAMATGHSLEHPTALADERLGDWVEWPSAVPAERYRRYLSHEESAERAARVIRAVRLSDTSPPVYYLLLHVWTRAFGTGASRQSATATSTRGRSRSLLGGAIARKPA